MDPEDIGKLKFDDLLTVGSRIFFQTHFYPMIKMQGQADEIFLSFKKKDGTDFPVLLNAAYINKGESFDIHFGGMKISNRNKFEKDIVAAKNAAEKALIENAGLIEMRNILLEKEKILSQQIRELDDKNHQITEINKILSHDLQEPLRKISFFSQKVKADFEVIIGDNGRKSLNKITDLIHKARALLEGLERYNALDTKKLDYTEVNLSNAMGSACKKLLPSLNHIRYNLTEGRFPLFFADYNLIVNMLAELVSNSLQFKKHDNELSIHIEAEVIVQNILLHSNQYHYKNFIRITYQDNGIGFQEQGIKLFEIFKKAHTQEKSVGIGLAYCKKIVQRHRGTIDVQSQEGVGTTFTILLPVDQD